MHLHTIASRCLTLAALCSIGMLGCDSTTEPADAQEARGGLLFDLTEEELVEIHATYVPEEDIELTRARLTAPFDCPLYGDFCDEVGAEAAERITGEMIDLAREGAPVEEIEALLETRSQEAVRELDPEALAAEPVFRANGTLAFHVQGNFRLGVRNGITTPIVGDRRAWTQATTWQFVEQGALSQWYLVNATQICVDTGINTQTIHFNGQEEELEELDQGISCAAVDDAHERATFHDRFDGNGSAWYDIEVHGSATAIIYGVNFSKTAPVHVETF